MNNETNQTHMSNINSVQSISQNEINQANITQNEINTTPLQNNVIQNIEQTNSQEFNNSNPPQSTIPNNVGNITENPAGIRKALKRDSKSKVKGYLIGATALLLIIVIVLAVMSSNLLNTSIQSGVSFENILPKLGGFIAVSIIISLVIQIFNYGITSTAFDLTRGKESSLGNIFTKSFSNIKAIFILLIVIEALSVITSIVTGIPLIGGLLSLIIMIYMYPIYDMLLCMYADDNYEKTSWLDMIKKSQEIIKGHRVEYYGTLLSFVGWILISVLTFGILFTWAYPYMRLTVVNMYRRWNGEINYNSNESGLSNGAVIGLSIGGYIAGVVVLSLIFVSMMGVGNINGVFNSLKNGSVNQNTDNSKSNIEEIQQSTNNNFLCGTTNDSDYNNIGTITYEQYNCIKNQANTFVLMISQTTCGYCYGIKPYLEQVAGKYNVPIYVLNINELSQEQKEAFISSIDYLHNNENWGTPLILAIKDNQTLEARSGYTNDTDNIENFFEEAELNYYHINQ